MKLLKIQYFNNIKWPFFLLILVVTLSFLLLQLACSSNKDPLIENLNWNNTNHFHQLAPDRFNSYLTDKLINDKSLIFLNQGPPDWKTFSGTLSSPDFKPSKYMVIPSKGFVYSIYNPKNGAKTFDISGGVLELECLSNNKKIKIINSPSQDYFEKSVTVPTKWCPGKARINVAVTEPDIFMSVGIPYKVNYIYSLVAGELKTFVAFGVSTLFLMLLILPFLLLTHLSYLLRCALSLIGLSFYAYVSYLAQAINIQSQFLLAFNFLFLVSPLCIFFYARSKGLAKDYADLLNNICFAWVILGFFIIFPAMIIPADGGAWTFNFLFHPLTLSTDNQLSTIMARWVMETKDIQPPGLGPWSAIDRGFLPAGLISGVLTSLDFFKLLAQNPIVYMISQMIVSLSNAVILAFLFTFPSFKNSNFFKVGIVASIICATPFFFFNVIYAWPKLIAGTSMLFALLLIANYQDAKKQFNHIALVPLLAVFGVLFHSSSLFLIPPLVLFFIYKLKKVGFNGIRLWSLLLIFFSILVSILFYKYHNSFGNKTSYGITFVLTGSGVFDLDGPHLKRYLMDYFDKMSFSWYLQHKFEQIRTIFWPPFPEIFIEKGFWSHWRVAQFYSVLQSLIIFTPLVLSITFLKGKLANGYSRLFIEVIAISVLSVASILIIGQLPFVVHHLPYTLMLSLLLLAILEADFNRKFIKYVILSHLIVFFLTWIVDPYNWWIVSLLG